MQGQVFPVGAGTGPEIQKAIPGEILELPAHVAPQLLRLVFAQLHLVEVARFPHKDGAEEMEFIAADELSKDVRR